MLSFKFVYEKIKKEWRKWIIKLNLVKIANKMISSCTGQKFLANYSSRPNIQKRDILYRL